MCDDGATLPELCHVPLVDVLDRLEVGHFVWHRDRLAAGRSYLARDRFRPVQIIIIDRDAAAIVPGKVESDLTADPLPRAGDQGYPPREIQYVGHRFPSPLIDLVSGALNRAGEMGRA